jgi:D-tyrosyl-tRNA(Tyr) deacylase
VYAVVKVSDEDTWSMTVGEHLYRVTKMAKKLVPYKEQDEDGDTTELMQAVVTIEKMIIVMHGITHVVVIDPQLLIDFRARVGSKEPVKLLTVEEYLAG